MAALAAYPVVGLSETFKKLREQGKVYVICTVYSAISVWNLYVVCLLACLNFQLFFIEHTSFAFCVFVG